MSSNKTSSTSTRATTALLAAVCAVAIAGCAGSNDAPQPGDSEPSVETPAEQAVDAAVDETSPQQLGTITVGTTTYNVVESVNCQPVDSSDVLDRTFEVIAVGQSLSGEDVLLFAYTDEQGGESGHYIDYQGPEGTLMTPDGNASLMLNGNNVSGSSTLIDDEDTQSVMVQFTFDVPDELVEC